jgi:heat shock protein HslJ
MPLPHESEGTSPEGGREARSVLAVRTLGRVTITGLLLVTAAACGSDGGSSSSTTSTSTAPAASPLDGTQWSLRDSADFQTQGVAVTLEFADGRVSGTGGCNNYSGPYRVQGSDLTIGPDLASTKMSCPPPADAVESKYLATLPNVRRFAVQGDTLQLSDADGTTLLELTKADPQAALLGTWNATSLYTGSAIQGVEGDATLTATFEGDTVSGDGGCNTFNGPYRAGRDDISIGPIASTLMACADDALSNQEQQFLAALQLAKSYRIRGDQLELQREGGTIAATFERATSG